MLLGCFRSTRIYWYDIDGNLCFHAVIITFPVLAPIKHVKEELSIVVQQQGLSYLLSFVWCFVVDEKIEIWLFLLLI